MTTRVWCFTVAFTYTKARIKRTRKTNKNLLLSDRAMIDTKPQLEIYADDVKHARRYDRPDERRANFYLRARGLDEESARRMISTPLPRSSSASTARLPARNWTGWCGID